MRRAFPCLLFCCAMIANRSWGQEPGDQAADEAAIRQAAATYAEAFNKQDAQALADHWSPRRRTFPEDVKSLGVTTKKKSPSSCCA